MCDSQENAAGLFEVKRGTKHRDTLADPEKLYAEIGQLKVELVSSQQHKDA